MITYLFLQYFLEELHLETNCLFELVLSDPHFEDLLPNFSHFTATQAVAEAMRVLHSAPAPQVHNSVHLGGFNAWLSQFVTYVYFERESNFVHDTLSTRKLFCHGNFGPGDQNSWKIGPPDHYFLKILVRAWNYGPSENTLV